MERLRLILVDKFSITCFGKNNKRRILIFDNNSRTLKKKKDFVVVKAFNLNYLKK